MSIEPMPKARAPSYTPAPELPTDPDLRRRYDEVMAVLTGQQSVTGAARSLALSRNHFQTLLHRALQAMIDSMTPKPAGRPARPEREVALEAENARLKAQLATLEERAATMERLLDLVGGIASGREALTRRTKKAASKKDEEPEPAATGGTTMCESRARRRTREPDPDRVSAVREIVRATHGLAGAAGLAKTTGVSRRQAAAIKYTELVAMERERKARCAQVRVTMPGVVRGFDAMHMICVDARYYWLVAADAAVPYRTSIATVREYDGENVAAAMTSDFEEHGPPLVVRLDRAACQRTPDVLAVLERYAVLPLHGPPRHPQYYGQLERQNREHRAWLSHIGSLSSSELPASAARMRTALNASWARPTLGWCTAETAWRARSTVRVDRCKLHRDVERRSARLVNIGLKPLVAQRRATEAALIDLGLLTINLGGEC